jgi:hypothetical protein
MLLGFEHRDSGSSDCITRFGVGHSLIRGTDLPVECIIQIVNISDV